MAPLSIIASSPLHDFATRSPRRELGFNLQLLAALAFSGSTIRHTPAPSSPAINHIGHRGRQQRHRHNSRIAYWHWHHSG